MPEDKKDRYGLFIVLEGIDGSGTTTQINHLHNHIKSLSRYVDVLTTHEPWRSEEIKRILEEDKDAYSNAEEMTKLYIEDRSRHVNELINASREHGVNVLSDRYMMSTFAYQGTQGVSVDAIRKMHQKMGIKKPDLTFFLDVDYEVARDRIKSRGGDLEKFESNEEFTRKLIENYRNLVQNEPSLGRIVTINGNNSIERVADEIAENFDLLFRERY